MLNVVNVLLEGGTGNYTFQRPFSQNLAVRPGLKFRELVKQYEDEAVNIF